MATDDTGPSPAKGAGPGADRTGAEALDRTLRELVQTLPGAVFRYSVAPDGSDRIDFISSGCTDIWEVDAATLQNDPTLLWAQVVPEDLPEMQASVARSAEDLAPWLHRWRTVTPSGKAKWLEGRGQPVRLPDGTTAWHSMILDVTEMEEARSQLYQREAELRALRTRIDRIGRVNAMGELTAALAHEVNQPLSAIVNYLHAASDLLSGLGPDAAMARELVARADEQARRTAGIIARIRSAFTGGEIETETQDLNAVICEAIEATVMEAGDASLVERVFDGDLPPVPIDRIQIQQVIVNLLRNAVAELENHPAPRITVTTSRCKGGIRLCVEDNGRGVPHALRETLFEPFATGRDEGSGIGLSISASIVAAHGGRITLEDAPGGGARFAVFLPAPDP